jgi:hypothetical protein
MWTYNVCRQLIVAAGKKPWPDAVPPDETPVIKEALAHPPERDQVYCIKTHFQIPVGKPHLLIICNYRDVRDAMLSYMRFMRCSFEKGLAVARGCMALTDHYLRHPHPQVLPVRYDGIISHPQETIRVVGEFLSLRSPDSTVEEIARSLSREAVRRNLRQIESLPLDEKGKLLDETKTAQFSAMRNFDGSFRIYDHHTGFQTDHISSNKDGAWRQALSDAEKDELIAATREWLDRYNFAI